MESKLTTQFKVPVSLCDNTARISVPGLFSLFMDLASEHGSVMGLGMDELAERGLIWLTVRTKICIHRRPKMLQPVTAVTWPETPGRVRCNRYYTLSDDTGILAEGKNEWAMYETETGRIHKLLDLYPEGMEHCSDIVCETPFAKVREDFSDCEELASYTIRSTDIDVSQHMNNVAYVRTVFSALPCSLIEKMDICEAEAAFRAQCFEGETLSIRMRQGEGFWEFGAVKADGKTAATVRLVGRKAN